MNVLVTGATGFVGGHLIPRLIDEGHMVTCLVRDFKRADALKEKYPVKTVIGDVTIPKSISGISVGIQYVIHLAAIGHTSFVTEESYRKFVGVNEGGTQNLVKEFSRSAELKKFIHFSSTAAMGPIGTTVQNEESKPNPVTPYQKSKNRSEQVITEAYERNHFPGIILRPCMIYGPGGYGEFYKFCRLMKKGVFPKVGLGANLTPLVYVEDVISVTLQALKKGEVGNTYIVASEQSIAMDDLHRYITDAIGTKAPYFFVPVPIALVGAKIIEKTSQILGKEPIVTYRNIKSTVTDRVFDVSKIKREFGYRQSTDFERGIQETIQWYRNENMI